MKGFIGAKISKSEQKMKIEFFEFFRDDFKQIFSFLIRIN